MNGFERLGASEYLVGAYSEVSDLWRRYEDFGEEQVARRAAEVLCEAFSRLAGDQEFWAATIDALGEAERVREAVQAALADLREFRAVEEEILRASGIPPEQASRLATGLVRAIRIAEELPNGDAVLNLQAHIEFFGGQICEVAKPDPPRGWKRRVVKGIRVLGGAAGIVVDAATAPALPITLLSIAGGVAIMIADVADD